MLRHNSDPTSKTAPLTGGNFKADPGCGWAAFSRDWLGSDWEYDLLLAVFRRLSYMVCCLVV